MPNKVFFKTFMRLMLLCLCCSPVSICYASNATTNTKSDHDADKYDKEFNDSIDEDMSLDEQEESDHDNENTYTISGNKYVSDEALLKIIESLRVKQMLNIENLLIELHNMEAFASISVHGKNIVVQEYESVSDVEIYVGGNNIFDSSNKEKSKMKHDILRSCKIKMHYPLKPSSINYMIENIKHSVASNAFLGATFVNCKIIQDESEKKVLRIDVDTIYGIETQSIEFIGNNHFRSQNLRMILPTKQKSILFGIINFPVISHDISKYGQSIESYYHSNGFLDAKVERVKAIKNNTNGVIIKIYINEGKRYRVRNITINNDSPLDDATVNSLLNVHKNSYFMKQYVQDFQYAIRRMLIDSGIQNMHVVYLCDKVDDNLVDIVFDIRESKKAHLLNLEINSTYANHLHMYRVLGLSCDTPTLIDDEFLDLCKKTFVYGKLYNDVTAQKMDSGPAAKQPNVSIDVKDKSLDIGGQNILSYGLTNDEGLGFDVGLAFYNIGENRDMLFDMSFAKNRRLWRYHMDFGKEIVLPLDARHIRAYWGLFFNFDNGSKLFKSAYQHEESLDIFGNPYPTKDILDHLSHNNRQYIKTDSSQNIETVGLQHPMIISDEQQAGPNEQVDEKIVAKIKNNLSGYTIKVGSSLNIMMPKTNVYAKFGVVAGSVDANDKHNAPKNYELYDAANDANYTDKTINGKVIKVNRLTNKRVLEANEITPLADNPAPGSIIRCVDDYGYNPDYLQNAIGSFTRLELDMGIKRLLFLYNDLAFYVNPGASIGIGQRPFAQLSLAFISTLSIGSDFELSSNIKFISSLNSCVLDNIPSDILNGCEIGSLDIINGYYLGGKDAILFKLNADYTLFKNHVLKVILANEVGVGRLSDSGVEQMRLNDAMIRRRNLPNDALRIANDGQWCAYFSTGIKVKVLMFTLKVMFATPINPNNKLNQVSCLRIGLGQ